MFVAPYMWFEAGEKGAQRGNKKADDVEEIKEYKRSRTMKDDGRREETRGNGVKGR
jgi:hypothetical protein